MLQGRRGPDRRVVLKTGLAATVAAPSVWASRARAAEQITVADYGGAGGRAMRVAFYDPFEQQTGIKVVGVAHDPDPTTQLKVLVETKSFVWDVAMLSLTNIAKLATAQAYLEPLLVSAEEGKDLIPNVLRPLWLGISVYGVVMAYRADKFPKDGPRDWRDFWNVKDFPGRRALFREPDGLLEQALMADGVAPHDLYPLDIDRAFRSLDRIKPHVNVWWSTGAQITQLLQNGEVDMAGTWAGPAYAAAGAGAPVKLTWKQGSYGVDGLGILKGTPRLDVARQFVRFCLDPKRQATYSTHVTNGPTNTKAYDYLSPERGDLLPTWPQNLKGLELLDAEWWGKNKARISQRFQEWLLG
jgi:putative spermidine/putrescine transport system substrate-binding protein